MSHFPVIGLFLLIILGAVGLPFPEDASLILCGFLIAHGVVNGAVAVSAVYIAVLAGDLIIYAAGRKFGEKIVNHRHFKRIISTERMAYLESQFKKRGFLLLLIGRNVLGLRGQLLLVSGVMKMPLLKFMVTDGIASLVTVAIMVSIGILGGNSLQVIGKDITRVEHAAVLVLILAFVIYLLIRYFKPGKAKPVL